MTEDQLYVGREQTRVKHFILQKYLERFAHIIGFSWNTITYVDCFSGPWNVRSDDLTDSSFAIALEELRKARDTHRKKGKTLNIRCIFLEKDPAAYARLKSFTDKVKDAQIETHNKELAEVIDEVLRFVRNGGKESFPFVFIDPTGWKGFEMNLIAPLLRLQPGEVLINFMTDYIRRFVLSPDKETQKSFAGLFGSGDFREQLQDLSEQDREDALFQAYAANVQKTGKFPFLCPAIVLYPEIERSFFHLIYATRNRKGVEVFKEVEKKAMQVMEQSRASAHQRKRVKKTSQPELFSAEYLSPSNRIDDLRQRYLAQTKQKVLNLLQGKLRVPYEDAWDMTLCVPLVWESDLKDWIREWQREGLSIEGMKPTQKVPKRDEGNLLVWKGEG